MIASTARENSHLRQMIDGYQVAQAIAVAASLGIADLLGDGPKTSDELARATGAHPRSLFRLLRALASVGVFGQDDDGRFAMTPRAEGLRSDAPSSLRAWAIHAGQPYMRAAWAHLHHSVMTGEPAFRHVHGIGSWGYRQQHPTAGEIFDRAMGGSAPGMAAIINADDFADATCIVDVGGGQGTFIAAVLAAVPTLRGILFDLPHVVGGAEPILRAAGVADRCTVVAGDFFEAIPAGGDLYILKGVIHDWADDAAATILRHCRRVMGSPDKLLLIEQVIQLGSADTPGTFFMDLHMLAIHGGTERTAEEFAALLALAGFHQTRIVPTTAGLNLIEAAPV